MTEPVWCLDTGVFVKFLIVEEPEELSQAAAGVVRAALESGRLIAPAFTWAEVGSVLRKQIRQGLLAQANAERAWSSFLELPIVFADSPAIRLRAWNIARQYQLATLYDAAFLACTELFEPDASGERTYWTADLTLVRSLGDGKPSYIRRLGADLP